MLHPFDGMAAGYDAGFTHSRIGRLMREAVWARLDELFEPGDRVLELGCGTGEDAVYLAGRGVQVIATDVSEGMLAATRDKVARACLGQMVQVQRLDIAELTSFRSPPPPLRPSLPPPLPPSSRFDGALANFGGLNCVADQAGAAAGLAALLRPGARALLCVMGPVVPWEWAWYLAQGKPGRALRRLRPGGVAWRGLTICYPAIGALRRAYAPWFRYRRVQAVGALVPPSYAEPWAARHSAALWALHRLERIVTLSRPLAWLADHYLIELERNSTDV